MSRIIIMVVISVLFFSCKNAEHKKQEIKKGACITEVVKALQKEFKTNAPEYLEPYKEIQKYLNDFAQNIPIDSLINTQDNTYSKPYFLYKDWNLDPIEKDDCEDRLYIVFDTTNQSFRLEINNCSIFAEDGDEHRVESALMFEYLIKDDCSYTFERINAAG